MIYSLKVIGPSGNTVTTGKIATRDGTIIEATKEFWFTKGHTLRELTHSYKVSRLGNTLTVRLVSPHTRLSNYTEFEKAVPIPA